MNIEQLGAAFMAAFVVMRLIDALVKPLTEIVNLVVGTPTPEERAEAVKRIKALWPQYVAVVIGSSLGWFTGINALPVFGVAPLVGRLLTCALIGLGPSFIFDLVKGKPQLPTA